MCHPINNFSLFSFKKTIFISAYIILIGIGLLLTSIFQVNGQQINAKDGNLKPDKKRCYIPEKVWMVPEGNDFTNEDSEFSYQRSVKSDNIVIFWSKALAQDISKTSNPAARLDISKVLQECDRFYKFYVDSLAFVHKGKSVTDQYKLLIFVFKGKEGTAFGGGEENKIGVAWTPIARISKAPFGALAHEVGHSFQYLVHADGAWAFTTSAAGSRGQPIFEMTSQFMLWHVYPEWMTFEKYHLDAYLKKTHYAFLHETNQYHSPYVLEYWANKHGVKFIGKLWQQALKDEDAVMAYKRLTNISQAQFNNEMHQASAKFMTWDLDQAKKSGTSYANRHSTLLDSLGNGWYQINASDCPQNYGYNGVKLNVPPAGTKVKLEFKGIAGANGFRKINVDYAGWRYSFVAVKKDGKQIYGKVNAASAGSATFTVPAHTQHLWLVVSGAPSTHWEHITDEKDENDEQWPYQIKLDGASPAKFN